ncbi:flocculation protein FLO11-like [Nylanderia fulva]|uniref:flocculation protein FLO11-like n=1 Tax=Nylanderia fulva TaxID=613905 RepID=UPI0010FB85A5|nr:flocculation protein FLO11-like [Nylanderia fulva]
MAKLVTPIALEGTTSQMTNIASSTPLQSRPSLWPPKGPRHKTYPDPPPDRQRNYRRRGRGRNSALPLWGGSTRRREPLSRGPPTTTTTSTSCTSPGAEASTEASARAEAAEPPATGPADGPLTPTTLALGARLGSLPEKSPQPAHDGVTPAKSVSVTTCPDGDPGDDAGQGRFLAPLSPKKYSASSCGMAARSSPSPLDSVSIALQSRNTLTQSPVLASQGLGLRIRPNSGPPGHLVKDAHKQPGQPSELQVGDFPKAGSKNFVRGNILPSYSSEVWSQLGSNNLFRSFKRTSCLSARKTAPGLRDINIVPSCFGATTLSSATGTLTFDFFAGVLLPPITDSAVLTAITGSKNCTQTCLAQNFVSRREHSEKRRPCISRGPYTHDGPDSTEPLYPEGLGEYAQQVPSDQHYDHEYPSYELGRNCSPARGSRLSATSPAPGRSPPSSSGLTAPHRGAPEPARVQMKAYPPDASWEGRARERMQPTRSGVPLVFPSNHTRNIGAAPHSQPPYDPSNHTDNIGHSDPHQRHKNWPNGQTRGTDNTAGGDEPDESHPASPIPPPMPASSRPQASAQLQPDNESRSSRHPT